MTAGYGRPFTSRAGASDKLLHSAGPSRPARQQTPTEGQRRHDRVWLRYVRSPPGSALLSAAPCSSGSLNRACRPRLNGVVYYSFVALLLPCLVCVAYLRGSAFVNSASAPSPEACSRAINSSPIPIQIPPKQTLGRTLSPG